MSKIKELEIRRLVSELKDEIETNVALTSELFDKLSLVLSQGVKYEDDELYVTIPVSTYLGEDLQGALSLLINGTRMIKEILYRLEV